MAWSGEVLVHRADVTGSRAREERRGSRGAAERARRTSSSSSATSGESPRFIELVRDSDRASTRTASEGIVPRNRSELLNRGINILLAGLALIILSPVMLLIAIAIKLTSRGPVLYTQTRVGLDRRLRRADALYDRREEDYGGRMFTIYKFRSMTMDAEKKSGAVWATPEDPRVTPVGRVLRRCRLDELPQLVNVLKGDMNIVGPRPERPSIFVRLRQDIPEYSLRQRTRPGITGWAQVNHSYDSCLDDVRTKVRYDLEYIQRQSLAEDFTIMLKTLPVMIFKRGGW
jgi:lipopolysaccharide/colanic/teichoic acid biosynthesis glycosyltransferase